MQHLLRLSLALVLGALVVPAQAQDRRDRDDRRDPPPRERPRDPADVRDLKVSGKVTSLGENQFVIRTDAGKDLTLYANPRTRFMIDGRAGHLADIKVGTTVNATYVLDANRYVVNDVVVGAALPGPAANEGTLLEGTIIKVVGNDQVIVRAADGRETIVYVTPQTKYTLTDRGGAFVDLQPNMPIRMYYDVRDRRATARAIMRGTVPPRRP